MTPPLGIWSLLALCCLNGAFWPQVSVTAAAQTVYCQSKRFEAGEIVTTKHNGKLKTYCGLPDDWYYVVKLNTLFHLRCAPGVASPTDATVEVLSMTSPAMRSQAFGNEELCDVRSAESTTGNNAFVVANKLAGNSLPYDRVSCNAQHYTEYLAYGQVLNPYSVKNSCPVFQPFNARSTVNAPVFKLAGKGVYYDWPTPNKGALLPVSTKRMSSNNSNVSRSADASQFKKSSWTWRNPFGSKGVSRDVDKRGGSTSSGHGFSGSRGGGGGDGDASTGGGGTGSRIPYYAHGGNRQHSAAAPRAVPFWRNWSWGSKNKG